jgi:uncharacterized protein
MMLQSVPEITALLRRVRSIAVVGASPNPARASHHVLAYLIEAGYTVFPVNPTVEDVLGKKCYPALAALPEPVDLVDCFRRSEEMPSVVEEAIAIKAGAIWMQQGVIHSVAASRAVAAGLSVVMDRCIMVDHRTFVAHASN